MPEAPTAEDRTTQRLLSVGWAPVEGADWYEVERDGGLVASPWFVAAYADPLVPAGRTASYRVRGVSAIMGPGPWSEPVQATAPPILFTDPLTPFEASGGSSLTTEVQERAFLQEVAERSDRVALEQIGTSVEGRPILLARIAHPVAPTPEETAERPVVFFNCTVHGNEWTPRESCLKLIRDLAFTDDPALTVLLSEVVVLVNPTSNPDGRAADRRENSQGLDVNRDYFELQSPEARAVVDVLNRYRPEVLLDGHNCCDDSIVPNWAQHPGVNEGIRTGAKALVEEGLLANGDRYGFTGQRSTLATGANPEIARNYSGLRHTFGLLNEVRSGTIAGRVEEQSGYPGAAVNRRVRAVSAFDFVLYATLQHYADHRTEIAEAIATSIADAEANRGPAFYGENPDQQQSPPPCGYLLTEAQHAQVEDRLALHQVKVEMLPDGVLVPMAQRSRNLIPLLLDARAGTRLVAAERLDDCPTSFAGARAELLAIVDAGGITEGLEGKVRHALDQAELWLTLEQQRPIAPTHLDRAVHLLLWQADVIEGKGKVGQGDAQALRALAQSIAELAAQLRAS